MLAVWQFLIICGSGVADDVPQISRPRKGEEGFFPGPRGL